ncbi:phage capsid protein [Hymenobacter sp. H14-R3]|uniref:phage capsid protein n=1 Tax=Hymenobacter sp. H14-R3 TaxID=3046308 RepID=UPI0024BBA6C7|nr:phage capsid protein [Hymenobacter sp. H14-R3]MDJ0363578.1 phage capsid protein [Hymenobacter sp. H14-R3]
MKLNFKNLVYNIVMAVLLAFIVAPMAGAGAGVVAGAGLFAVGCLLPAAPATAAPMAFMAIQKEIWVTDIAENVFPDNTFLSQCRDDSEFLSGKTVHLPQAGTTPNTEKNRQTLPATAQKRTDTIVDYDVDELTTDPVVLQMTEAIEASYPKRQSILHDHVEKLATDAADIASYVWTPSLAKNIVPTTGDARPANKEFQTGNRKAMTKKDILTAQRLLNNQNVPQVGRCCLIDSDMLMDLLLIPEFTQAYAIGQNSTVMDGTIARLFGFKFYVRSETTLFTGAGAKKSPDVAKAVTDNVSALFWHPSFVRFAKGSTTNGGIQVFEDAANPLYYGDVFSALLRVGGTTAYANQRGVVAVYEAPA